MQELVKVVVDAMGGDNAPQETVKGAVDAVNTRKDIKVILTGRQELVEGELSKYTYPKDRIEVVNTTEVIEMAEPPVNAIRKKKDSSIVVGMNLVKKGEADAFVSAGSTGAVLVGGQVIVGRIKGVERPPLAPLIPTKDGVALLIDCGANVDARPSHLVQFAKMGSIYMENVVGVKNPRVGIVNIGSCTEEMPDLRQVVSDHQRKAHQILRWLCTGGQAAPHLSADRQSERARTEGTCGRSSAETDL